MLSFFNTSFEIAESEIDTAVLPLGGLEPRGPHLPIGLAMMLADRFGRDFCAGKAVYLLPVFPFSESVETRGFKGSVGLCQQSVWDVLEDVARFLARHRFRRLIVLDLANYNWIVKHAVREINLDKEILQAVWVNPRQFAVEAAGNDLLPDYGGGAVDTSLAMSLFAPHVKTLPPDFEAGAPREYIDYEGLRALAPEGYWGKPSKASAETGAALYKVMLDETRKYVDYALGLFPGGEPIGAHDAPEIWWPEGEIHGLADGGLDWHNSLAEIAAAAPELVIIPTSATEQHSPCMPLGTDYFQALELARGAAKELGAYLLPALPFVTSWGHARFRGTVTLRGMTVRRVLEDTARSLYEGGFRKAAIVNVHGGNWVVKPTLIEINRAYPDLRLVTTGDILAYRGQAPVEHLHADKGEGSFIKAFCPESFKDDRVIDFSPNCTASAFDLVGIGGVTPYGVWGYPSQSTAEEGRARLAERIREAADGISRALAGLENRFGPGPQ